MKKKERGNIYSNPIEQGLARMRIFILILRYHFRALLYAPCAMRSGSGQTFLWMIPNRNIPSLTPKIFLKIFSLVFCVEFHNHIPRLKNTFEPLISKHSYALYQLGLRKSKIILHLIFRRLPSSQIFEGI